MKMKTEITYWKGINLGPGRKEWMKKHLRLKEVELPGEEEIADALYEYLKDKLPNHKGPFISNAEAQRVQNWDYNVHMRLCQKLANKIIKLMEGENESRRIFTK